MDPSLVLYPLLGGAIIGVAVTLMLLFNGRVTGISGIVSSAISTRSSDNMWRWAFLIGLTIGGVIIHLLHPDLLTNLSNRNFLQIIIAGVLVGYGTVMGSGCTSGHGVCGISRFSIRSLIATATFILFGFLAVTALRFLNGGAL
ncbi:YeeE/YedE family protein [Bdellovibrio sp. NC01]|uniref:YeeE/YedE family protein n=1 Tax=Bdellovibrio sp. NC01 TaxID=2220073 RepID=UPI001158EDF8|nr:YeeE/YedE thiosulfate transporter family protein [Bdellovibrio sp. NC01]QDK39351.1 YeeE/YedE family protein [Bdellovibrio sp. NC01]